MNRTLRLAAFALGLAVAIPSFTLAAPKKDDRPDGRQDRIQQDIERLEQQVRQLREEIAKLSQRPGPAPQARPAPRPQQPPFCPMGCGPGAFGPMGRGPGAFGRPGMGPMPFGDRYPAAKPRLDAFVDQLKKRLDEVKSANASPADTIDKLRGVLRDELSKLDRAAEAIKSVPPHRGGDQRLDRERERHGRGHGGDGRGGRR